MGYERMAREALRGIVRMALERAAGLSGLPGHHHFYLTFQTRRGDVEMPARLREKYPAEMTIVLKRHFWDLDVQPDRFSVSLSFDQQEERLTVPYAAVSRFYDPVAHFAMEFPVDRPEVTPMLEPAGRSDTEPTHVPGGEGGEVVRLDAFRNR